MYVRKDVFPFIVMVGLECGNVGTNTLFKAATDRGMSYYVFLVYSYSLASLILLPTSFFHRRTLLPPLNSRIIGLLFLLGLIGSGSVLSGYKGIEYGSPTLASAMSNLIPAFTFILAIVFRMEKVAWRSSTSLAKILGTVVSITGAIIVILYKGPSLIVFHGESSSSRMQGELPHSTTTFRWIIGGLLLGVEYILTPIWYILEAQIIKEYPAELVVIFYYSIFVAIINGAVASIVVPDRAAWVLKPDVSLAAIIYSGVFGSFLSNSVHAWILRRKGPVYIAMFKPLSIAIAAAMGIIFLGDTLHLGCVIGSAVISMGFYAMMWGKVTEELHEGRVPLDLESSSEKAPLLPGIKPEDS